MSRALRLSPVLARARPSRPPFTLTAPKFQLDLHHNNTSRHISLPARCFSVGAPTRSSCAETEAKEEQKQESEKGKEKQREKEIERWPDSLVTLAIETSCDDTCVAILEKERESDSIGGSSGKRITRSRLLFEERITADNRQFKGIHPLTAAVSHTTTLGQLVKKSLAYLPHSSSTNTGFAKNTPDFVSVTRGPGMQSSLVNGLGVAKGLALAWGVPLLGVHHMQAHSLTPRLVSSLRGDGDGDGHGHDQHTARFPYLSFLVSGGHTMLVHSRSLCDHRVLAAAHNIAVGDLLDKCARALLPQGYIDAAEASAGRSLPFGALLESFAFAAEADYSYTSEYRYPLKRRDEMVPFQSPYGWTVDPPLGAGALRSALRFDFSGLNGQVNVIAEGLGLAAGASDDERRLLARATMHQAFEHLASRLLLALKGGAGGDIKVKDVKDINDATCIVVSGGVASNGFLRHVLRSALDVHGFGHLRVVAPPPVLCTDNAAMIAWAGMEMYEAGWETDLGIGPIRKWSMDPTAEDGGIIGIGGWVKREGM